MKNIYFIRHAKSSWADMSLRDFDRPLNKRGLRDAPFMAKMLKGKGVQPDGIIYSPANRAYTTATYFAETLNVKEDKFVAKPQIYEAYPETVVELVQNLPNDWQTVLVFGHNPAFTSIANYFSKEYIPNVPTCGIVKIEANIEDWSSLNEENGKLTDFYFPKQYFD